jgi:hypothetical protein
MCVVAWKIKTAPPLTKITHSDGLIMNKDASSVIQTGCLGLVA